MTHKLKIRIPNYIKIYTYRFISHKVTIIYLHLFKIGEYLNTANTVIWERGGGYMVFFIDRNWIINAYVAHLKENNNNKIYETINP